MKRIIPDHVWEKHFRAGKQYEGERFEQLAFVLLEELHGPGWKATTKTHDGSRDFEQHGDNGVMWAECKAYKNNLSFHTISPTLVMALVGDPRTVIILSRSPLNNKAINVLARYHAKANKQIISYDGAVLDQAILASPNAFHEFFPGEAATLASTPSCLVKKSISAAGLLHPVRGDFTSAWAPPPNTSIETVRYDLIRIDLLVKNLSPLKPASVRASIVEGSLPPGLKVISLNGVQSAHETVLTVPPGGVVIVEIMLQPHDPEPRLTLPRLILAGAGIPPSPITTGTARVSSLYQIPLVGENALRILSAAKRITTGHRGFRLFCIEGMSGVGKSRLLRELEIHAISCGYQCHHLDFEFSDPHQVKDIIIELVADLHDLPNPTQFSNFEGGWGIDGSASTLLNCLFSKDFDVWGNIDTIADIIYDRLKHGNTLISIDNVQDAPDTFINFLELLTKRLNQAKATRALIALAFNTDLLPPTSRAATFLHAIRGLGEGAATRRWCGHFVLEPFSRKDVEEFLAQSLGGGDSSAEDMSRYEQTVDMFLGKVEPKPLNLWQTLMYLRDSEALRLDGDRFVVSSHNTILEILSTIPKRLADLLGLRWEKVLHKSGKAAGRLELCARVAYLLGSAHRNHFTAMGARNRDIDALVRHGFLTEIPGGFVRFFHQQLFHFFRQYVHFSKRQASSLLSKMIENKLNRRYFQQCFILAFHAGHVSTATVRGAVESAWAGGLNNEYGREFCDSLLSALNAPGRRTTPTTLKGYMIVGEWLQRLRSLRAGCTVLWEAFHAKVVKAKTLPGPQLLAYYHSTINGLLAVYEDSKAREVIELALTKIETSDFPSTKDRLGARGYILNRKTATLKNYSLFEEAIKAGTEAMSIFETIDDKVMLVRSMYDVASVMMGMPSLLEEGVALLGRSVDLFDDHPEVMHGSVANRRHIAAAKIALWEKRFDDAIDIAGDGIVFCMKHDIHFWGVRHCMMKTVAFLLKAQDQAHYLDDALKGLHHAQDWANIAGAERSVFGLTYLRGKISAAQGFGSEASMLFSRAIVQLSRQLKASERIPWKGRMLKDMALTSRETGNGLRRDALALIPNKGVAGEMSLILEADEDSYRRLRFRHIREAAYSNGNYFVEFP